MNIPYGCVMVATNESLKKVIAPKGDYTISTYLLAGSGAGALAAIATTPFDLVKTRLQTQSLNLINLEMEGIKPVEMNSMVSSTNTTIVGSSSTSTSLSSNQPGSNTFSTTHQFSTSRSTSMIQKSTKSLSYIVSHNLNSSMKSVTAGKRQVSSVLSELPTRNLDNNISVNGTGSNSSLSSVHKLGKPGQSLIRHHGNSATQVTPLLDKDCIKLEKIKPQLGTDGELRLSDIKYKGLSDTVKYIYRNEGITGFFRGVGPRLLVHMPSVAISWTTYETAKTFLKANMD